MIDKVIIKNIENQEEMMLQIEAEIEKDFNKLNLDDILEDPAAFLGNFAEEMAIGIIDRHAENFINEGVRFAEEVEELTRKVKFNKNPDDNTLPLPENA